MQSLTRWVLTHKRLVAIFWVIATIAGIAAAGPAGEAMKQPFSVPGREGWETNSEITKKYGGGGGNPPFVPVVSLPKTVNVNSPEVKAGLEKVGQLIREAVPNTRIASYATTGNRAFVSKDGHTTFILAHPPVSDNPFGGNAIAEQKVRDSLKDVKVAGVPVLLTGLDALQDSSGGGDGPGVFLEALFGGLGALAVLAFVFASLMAFVPIVIAIISIMTTFLLVLGLTAVTDISPIVQFLIALIGLGVAIDYSLLIAVRWREERAHGHEGDEAVIRAMSTAGRSVLFSGTTVAIGLLAMIALPVPFLRSIGYGGMLIPFVSVVVSITVMPLILAKFGKRLDWPHIRTDDRASKAWTGWAQLVVRHRWVAAGVATVILGFLVYASASLNLASTDPNTIAKEGDAKAGLVALEKSGIGGSALFPIEVLAPVSQANAETAAKFAELDGVHGAVAPVGNDWQREGKGLIEVFQVHNDSTESGRKTLADIRDTAHILSSDLNVGGIYPESRDFLDAVYGNFPLMIGLIALITFVLLARAFRSLLLPAKAVLLNLISVLAAWGIMTLIWQKGYGSEAIWGIEPTGSIDLWIPLMVFAFLFGLSMDYEVFILARMREEYDKTGSTREAVIRGIGRTGRLVTSAALILFLAFMSLASAPDTTAKIFATGLAAGILLDATIIRALLVPAVVSLFGRWNWVLPKLPARLLRVEPSLPPRTVPEEIK